MPICNTNCAHAASPRGGKCQPGDHQHANQRAALAKSPREHAACIMSISAHALKHVSRIASIIGSPCLFSCLPPKNHCTCDEATDNNNSPKWGSRAPKASFRSTATARAATPHAGIREYGFGVRELGLGMLRDYQKEARCMLCYALNTLMNTVSRCVCLNRDTLIRWSSG